MGIGSKTVKTFLGKVPWAKTVEKAGGAKDRGDRSTDSNTGKVELILQANKGADDPEVKKAAQKDSDAILGKVLVDPKKPDAEEAKEELLRSFKERN